MPLRAHPCAADEEQRAEAREDDVDDDDDGEDSGREAGDEFNFNPRCGEGRAQGENIGQCLYAVVQTLKTFA